MEDYMNEDHTKIKLTIENIKRTTNEAYELIYKQNQEIDTLTDEVNDLTEQHTTAKSLKELSEVIRKLLRTQKSSLLDMMIDNKKALPRPLNNMSSYLESILEHLSNMERF